MSHGEPKRNREGGQDGVDRTGGWLSISWKLLKDRLPYYFVSLPKNKKREREKKNKAHKGFLPSLTAEWMMKFILPVVYDFFILKCTYCKKKYREEVLTQRNLLFLLSFESRWDSAVVVVVVRWMHWLNRRLINFKSKSKNLYRTIRNVERKQEEEKHEEEGGRSRRRRRSLRWMSFYKKADCLLEGTSAPGHSCR